MDATEPIPGLRKKVVLAGTTGVGKTSIMVSKVRGTGFSIEDEEEVTIGMQQHSYDCEKDGNSVHVILWDTAGMEKYRSLNNLYYRDADAAIIVYDITSNSSFGAVTSFCEQIEAASPGLRLLCLVGNKADQETFREVDRERAERYAEEHDMYFLEVSAKDHTNIDKLFQDVGEALLTASPGEEIGAEDSLIEPQSGGGRCC